MPQNFSFTAPSFQSWDSSSGPENLPPFPPIVGKRKRLYPAMLTAAENCRFSREGGVSIRLGYLNKGATGSGVQIRNMKGFETDYFKVMFIMSGTKIYQTINPDAQTPIYYDIGLTRTSGQVDFLTAKRKDMIANNPIDGEVRIFTSALQSNVSIANSTFTIPQGDTDELTNTGTVYIRGIAVTYVKPITVTADAGADTLTANNHLIVNGTIVTFSNTGGALPTGITAGTTYYVIGATANTFQISTTLGGSALDITGAGSGTNTAIAEDGIIRQASGLTAAMVTGDIVTQTTAYAASPKATCMAELLGSCLAGGVLKDPTALKYSVQSTEALPGNFFDFAGSGSGSKPMPRDITAMLTGTRLVLVGLIKGLNYASDFDANGALITTPVNSVHSIPNAYCMTQMDENFGLLTSEGRILPAGQTNAGFKVIEDPKKPNTDLDYPVQKFIQDNIDKSNVSANFQYYDPSFRILTNHIRLTTGVSTDIMLSTDTGGWSRDTSLGFSCKTIFKGRTYCGSDSADTIYLEGEGLDDDGLDIAFRIVTGQMNYSGSRLTLDVMKITIGGLLSAVGSFTVNVYTDGNFAYTTTITAQQMINKGLMNTKSGHPIGAGQIGSDRIGDGGNGIEAFLFVCPMDVMFECRTIQLEIISTDAIEIRNFDIDIETEGEELFDTF